MICEHCEGMGIDDIETRNICRYCGGTGDQQEIRTWIKNRVVKLKRTTFSRLSSSVDEMVMLLVAVKYDCKGNSYFSLSFCDNQYSTREEAFAAAKEWLMEVEE